jgi:hypothetical protein
METVRELSYGWAEIPASLSFDTGLVQGRGSTLLTGGRSRISLDNPLQGTFEKATVRGPEVSALGEIPTGLSFDNGTVKGRGSTLLLGRWIHITVIWNEGNLVAFVDGPELRIGFPDQSGAGTNAARVMY